MNLKCFSSRTVRLAGDASKHVRKLLASQRDILSPQAVTALETAITDLNMSIATAENDDAITKQISNLETVANKWLKPYPYAGIRENVEVLLVALAVAMSIRTFFVQPFKIPTGSMQPTLWGITPPAQPGLGGNQPDLKIPGALERLWDFWARGESYYNVVAPEDGELQAIGRPHRFLLFNYQQDYVFNNKTYSIWFPADDLFMRAGYVGSYGNGSYGNVYGTPEFKAGEPIIRLKCTAGDHLFVDRISYNFRHPKRGEIIVFETRGIGNEYYHLPPDQFYIKRLVALGDERVQIGEDRHLIINGKRLDASTPHFEKIYSFDPNEPPRESHYSGHVDGPDAKVFYYSPDHSVTVRPGHFMVMGDNTMNSLDSRMWGDFTQTNVIGKYFFVYWPFTERFGWSVK